MVNFCNSFNCTSSSDVRKDLSFHKFLLKVKDRPQQWIHAVRRKDFKPSSSLTLCRLHFSETEFYLAVVKCDVYQSIRKDTFFYKSHLSMYTIVNFTYLWTKSVSLSFLSEELGIAQHTAVDWAYFHREVVFDGMIIHHEKIGGVGKTVEIEESKFGECKYHRGHAVEGQWIFGGIQLDNGACFLIPVEKRDKETLLAIIKEWVLPGTQIISDCWKSYDCLNDEDFIHFKVNNSVNFKDPNTGVHTITPSKKCGDMQKLRCLNTREKNISMAATWPNLCFLKKCCILNLDPIIEFFRLAGNLYDPNKYNNDGVDVSYDDDTDII